MRHKRILVWDAVVPDTTPVFSSMELHDLLGLYDQLTFHAVCDGASVSNTLTCDLMHSGDGIWWVTETAAVLSGSIATNTTNHIQGASSDNATQQGLALRRVKITLSVASPVHVKIWALAHDQSLRAPGGSAP